MRRELSAMIPRYEMLADVRGKGLMIGIEFGAPKSFGLKASWNVVETANPGLFCQLITIPLFKDHKILCQVAGHGSHTIKLLPTLGITDDDCNWIVNGIRHRRCRQPSRAGRRLVTWQNTDQPRGARPRLTAA